MKTLQYTNIQLKFTAQVNKVTYSSGVSIFASKAHIVFLINFVHIEQFVTFRMNVSKQNKLLNYSSINIILPSTLLIL